MAKKRTRSGYHISSRSAKLKTPGGAESTGVYIECAGRVYISLHYAGDDAVAEAYPAFELPVDVRLLRDLAKALNEIAREAEKRVSGR